MNSIRNSLRLPIHDSPQLAKVVKHFIGLSPPSRISAKWKDGSNHGEIYSLTAARACLLSLGTSVVAALLARSF